MSEPTVSCIIAAYNGEQYLGEAIASLLAQTRRIDEVIVVDDGSTDATAQLAADFGAPVRVIRQANAGQSVARNRGVAESTGDLLSFLDCDDLVHPRKLEWQLQRFTERPELVLVDAYARNFWSPEIPEHDRKQEGWMAHTHSDQPWPQFIATWLFRRELWTRIGGFDENRRFAEDSDWYDRAAYTGLPIETLPTIVARRRLHHDNLTRTNYENHMNGLWQFYKERIGRERQVRSID